MQNPTRNTLTRQLFEAVASGADQHDTAGALFATLDMRGRSKSSHRGFRLWLADARSKSIDDMLAIYVPDFRAEGVRSSTQARYLASHKETPKTSPQVVPAGNPVAKVGGASWVKAYQAQFKAETALRVSAARTVKEAEEIVATRAAQLELALAALA
jgi:hypothetical protein